MIALGGDPSNKPDHKVRLITISAKPHKKCMIAPAPNCDGTIRIATNRLDLPAEVIALDRCVFLRGKYTLNGNLFY